MALTLLVASVEGRSQLAVCRGLGIETGRRGKSELHGPETAQSVLVPSGAVVSSRQPSAWHYLTVRLVGAGRTLPPPVVPPPLVVPLLPAVVPPPPPVVPPLPLNAASRRLKFTPGSVASDALPL